MVKRIEDICVPNMTIQLQTNRHTYSEEIADELSSFAKIHEYDGRKEFKEAWNEWLKEPAIESKIKEEITRLEQNGLKGDILDRMYKSTRYYYRKKTSNTGVTQEIKKRKQYVGLPKTILVEMDEHIHSEIKESIVITEKLTGKTINSVNQATSFTNYCRDNYEMIKEMIPVNREEKLDNENIRNEIKMVTDKLKKTYKNRFYKIKMELQHANNENNIPITSA